MCLIVFLATLIRWCLILNSFIGYGWLLIIRVLTSAHSMNGATILLISLNRRYMCNWVEYPLYSKIYKYSLLIK